MVYYQTLPVANSSDSKVIFRVSSEEARVHRSPLSKPPSKLVVQWVLAPYKLLLFSLLYCGCYCQNPPVALPPSELVVNHLLGTEAPLQTASSRHLRGTNHAKKCEMYAGVTGSAVYDSNICYICELPPSNNTYNTVTKLCSNGESPFIYFSIYIPNG